MSLRGVGFLAFLLHTMGWPYVACKCIYVSLIHALFLSIGFSSGVIMRPLTCTLSTMHMT